MSLRSFWYEFHVNLTIGSTAVVCYYLQDMGAMTSLHLSNNELGPEGAKHLAEGIKVIKRVVAVVLVPFSCLSDHWLN
jgi:hypothetical protein